jgi:hypothetical protein
MLIMCACILQHMQYVTYMSSDILIIQFQGLHLDEIQRLLLELLRRLVCLHRDNVERSVFTNSASAISLCCLTADKSLPSR